MWPVSYFFTLAVLAYASYSDYRTREVSDLVWIVGCPIGLALSLIGVASGGVSPLELALSAAAAALAGLAVYKLGLVGGADALALLFIGLSLPAYPEGMPVLGDPFKSPFFSVFCNAALLSLACPVSVFILNVADVIRGRDPFKGVRVENTVDLLVLLFTARRVSLEKLLSGLHYFPAEKPVEDGGGVARVPLRFVSAEADFSEVTSAMASRKELYSDGVLASPTLPMIVFLTLGLLLLPLGNIVYIAFAAVF